MSEHHPGRFSREYCGWRSTLCAAGVFMTRDLKPTVRAPGVVVSPGDEHRLPYSQMFLGTALAPLGYCEVSRLECPLSLLFPLGELFCFLIAGLMVEPFCAVG